MEFYKLDLLNDKQKENIAKLLPNLTYSDGSLTAHGEAKSRKKNFQAEIGENREFLESCESLIKNHNVISALMHPVGFPRVFVNKYGVGQYYGKHIDKAIIGEQRCDLSFTLFLSSPEDYEGGELLVYKDGKKILAKLQFGQMVVYSPKLVHEVLPITSGERVCLVGWITSAVPSVEDRATLRNVREAISALKKLDLDYEQFLLPLMEIEQDLIRRFSR